jgi:hypothetical protein
MEDGGDRGDGEDKEDREQGSRGDGEDFMSDRFWQRNLSQVRLNAYKILLRCLFVLASCLLPFSTDIYVCNQSNNLTLCLETS